MQSYENKTLHGSAAHIQACFQLLVDRHRVALFCGGRRVDSRGWIMDRSSSLMGGGLRIGSGRSCFVGAGEWGSAWLKRGGWAVLRCGSRA